MFKRILKKLFSEKKPEQHVPEITIPEEVIEAFTEKGDELRYPPAEKGFPAKLPGYALLDLQKEILAKIKRELMIRDSEFDAFVSPMLRNFANFVHLLPASEYHHHRSQGGLLRHTLEVVLYSIKLAKNFEFDANEVPVIKSDRALAWRLAVVVGAVMHDIGKPISDVDVFDATGNHQWMPAVNFVHEWATDLNITRYFIYWRDDRHERHHNASLTKMTDIVPRDLLSFLTREGNDIYNELTEALAGSSSFRAQTSRAETGSIERNKIHKIVSSADSSSVTLDLKLHAGDAVRAARTGVPVLARIVDAMRYLVKNGDWKPNKAGSPVWYTTEGLFIVWGSAVDSITSIVRQSGVNVPHSADSLADIMLTHNLCSLTENDSVYWRVAPHILNDKSHRESKEPKNSLSCIRLVDPIIIFVDDMIPNPTSCRIKVGDNWVEFLASGSKGKIRESKPYVGDITNQTHISSKIDPEILKGGTLPMEGDRPPSALKKKDIIEQMLSINLLSPEKAKAIRERDERERRELEEQANADGELSEQHSQAENREAEDGTSDTVKHVPEQQSLFTPDYVQTSADSEEQDYSRDWHDMDMSLLQSSAPAKRSTNEASLEDEDSTGKHSSKQMSLKERMALIAIQDQYQEDEKKIRTDENEEKIDLWSKARSAIRNQQDITDGHIVNDGGENTLLPAKSPNETHIYSNMFREAPEHVQNILRQLIEERKGELFAENYRLFVHCKDEKDNSRYDTLSVAGLVWKSSLEPYDRIQMFKSKPGFFLKRELNEDINYLSGGEYYKAILPMDPRDVYFDEDEISRAIATYGVQNKTHDNETIMVISGYNLRRMAISLGKDISTTKFIICFYYDSILKRGAEHVFVDGRIQKFMVTSYE